LIIIFRSTGPVISIRRRRRDAPVAVANVPGLVEEVRPTGALMPQL
jgi:hypothetical protein